MEAKEISGLVFVALMFIGAGVGLLFERPDVGGAIGMGLGFLAMAYIRARYREIRPEEAAVLGRTGGSLILALAGVFFIAAGIVLLLGIELPLRALGGIVAIALGLLFLIAALRLVRMS